MPDPGSPWEAMETPKYTPQWAREHFPLKTAADKRDALVAASRFLHGLRSQGEDRIWRAAASADCIILALIMQLNVEAK